MGTVSLVVKLSNGCKRHCHQDQLQKQTVQLTVENPADIPLSCAIATDQNSSQVYTILGCDHDIKHDVTQWYILHCHISKLIHE